MTTSQPSSPRRTRRSRGDDARAGILTAALREFANVGFEGATIRTIAQQAGVPHTLVLYHYKDKDTLWRAAMERAFAGYEKQIDERLQTIGVLPPREGVRVLLRDFVHFCAQAPEFHRIMAIEGRQNTERLVWMVERHTRPAFQRLETLVAALRAADASIDIEPIQFYYAVIGLASAPFTLASEYRMLSGRDPFAEAEIERIADFVLDTLLPQV